jgi:hypothetical protein
MKPFSHPQSQCPDRLPDGLHRWTTTLQGSHRILHVSFAAALGTCVLPLLLLLCNLLFQHALQLLILLPAKPKTT